LNHFHGIDAFEYCEEEGDLLHDEVFLCGSHDIDAVAYVVWVFDEEEDAGAEEFLSCYCEDEGEGEEGCACCCEGGDEVGVLECDWYLLALCGGKGGGEAILTEDENDNDEEDSDED
jgi:hypothetical protein